MNTNCSAQGLGGCDQGSPQETWLKEDLAKHPNACVLAYGHHALFSSGFFKKHAVHPELKQLWEDLYAAHADLVLAGHEHSYERFAPQDPQSKADPVNGIREIVVGTGGRSHDLLGFATPNSEAEKIVAAAASSYDNLPDPIYGIGFALGVLRRESFVGVFVSRKNQVGVRSVQVFP